MVVPDNMWVLEGVEDGELGMELLALLLGHFDILDLFPTKYLDRMSAANEDGILNDT